MDPDMSAGSVGGSGRTPLSGYVPAFAAGGVAVICIAVAASVLVRSATRSVPIRFSSDSTQALSVPKSIAVDIQGAVAHPGVYRLALGSRVDDLIATAGGLTHQADSERVARSVNRAAILSDGAKLYIPTVSEVGERGVPSTEPLHDVAGARAVSVNTASADDLIALPGIGETTAKNIIAARPYATLEELVSKKAIGKSLFGKLKGMLSL